MAVKTLSSYPKEFLDIWQLALAGTLLLNFPKRGTAVNLRWRLYTYRKRLDEEAPDIARQFKDIDLMVRPELDGTHSLVSYIPEWKKQAREQMAQLATVLPGTPVAAQLPQVPSVAVPISALQPNELPPPPSDSMDDTLSRLGFGTGKPVDDSNNH